MLREVERTQQKAGEPRRRWFFSHEMDLLMWFDEENKPVAFQLAYGKYHNEHAIRWKVDRGFTHHRVEDGRGTDMGAKTPLLIANGAFNASLVLEYFRRLSSGLPPELIDFVVERIIEHPEYREET